MARVYFTGDVFRFLEELAANNNREWWEDNKRRYEEVVREPALDFITDFGRHLDKLSPHFLVQAKTVGGSLMRPHRDIRFSKDKTPYKTNVGIHFRHESAKDVHAPGYYLHLEPGECFAGVGMWQPEPAIANAIRTKINGDAEGWKRATRGKAFTETWELSHPEASLKRLPKDFDADHPYADDMRLKSFMAGRRLTEPEVTTPGFDAALAAAYSQARGFTRFLCEAVGLPF